MTVATGVMQYVDEELEVFSLSRLNAAADDLGFVNLQLGRIGSQLAILTTDASFEGVFAPDSMSFQPIEILAPQGDAVERIAVVTANFPRFVSASAAATWKTYIAPGASTSAKHGFYDPLDVLASSGCRTVRHWPMRRGLRSGAVLCHRSAPQVPCLWNGQLAHLPGTAEVAPHRSGLPSPSRLIWPSTS